MNLIFMKTIAIIIFFFLGFYYYVNYGKVYESMENNNNNNSNHRCPNMLIEKDGVILLYNSNLATVPGVNPIQFNSLDEYSDFINWQNGQNIHCPVLYLQYSTDTQNNDLIQIKPSIFENQGGLPNNPISIMNKENNFEENKILDANLDNNKIFNSGSYKGFDSMNQNIGLDTPLDKMFHELNNKSANPMDPHWGGKDYTYSKIEAGDYKDRYVYKHAI